MTSPASNADKFADAATSFLGCRFKLHGRNPETGLDCIGLVLKSLNAIGFSADGPRRYGLRNTAVDHWIHYANAAGFRETFDPEKRGDLVLSRSGPAQHHLAIFDTGGAIIHAHAGLRRIVRQPFSGASAAMIRWRLYDPI